MSRRASRTSTAKARRTRARIVRIAIVRTAIVRQETVDAAGAEAAVAAEDAAAAMAAVGVEGTAAAGEGTKLKSLRHGFARIMTAGPRLNVAAFFVWTQRFAEEVRTDISGDRVPLGLRTCGY